MNILFHKSQIKSYSNKLLEYNNANYNRRFLGKSIQYRFLDPALEEYSTIRAMQGEGVEVEGFTGFLRLSKVDYENNEVPVGVSYSMNLDVNGDPLFTQKKWNEWQPIPTIVKNDDTEVLIPTTYKGDPADELDFDLFESSADIKEIMGLIILRAEYFNDITWITDELGAPLPEPLIDKTAFYYLEHWETEAFDFIHAQRLVNNWFSAIPAVDDTARFNSLNNKEKKAVIRWGILGDSASNKALIEATLGKNKRIGYRAWNSRRAEAARTIRFSVAWLYLRDNFKTAAIKTKMPLMLTYELKDFYILYGKSNKTEHLIVGGEINVAFWAQFAASDVGYTDVDLATIKTKVEKILDGNKYAEAKVV